MKRLPSLDDYDVMGVPLDEAEYWTDDIREAIEGQYDEELYGMTVEN